MDKLKVLLLILMGINLVLFFIGNKKHKYNTKLMINPDKEYSFYSLFPIGYGVLTLMPFISSIYIDGVYSLYRSRFDDESEVEAHYKCFLAQEITFLFVAPLLGGVLVLAALTTSDKQNVINALLFTVILTIGLFVNGYYSMLSKEKQRLESIKDSLPDLLNRIVILLNSGMQMINVFANVGSMGEGTPLQEEMYRVNLDIINHKNVVYALSRMQRRCPCFEVSRLYNIVEASVNKGAHGASELLANLSFELWEEKKNNVKKKSASLAQKLLLPTFVLFAVVVVIVAAPSFIYLKQY